MNIYDLTRDSKNLSIGFSLFGIVMGIGLLFYIARVPFLQVYALGLGEQIKQYAPHLFEKEKSAQSI